MKLIILGPQGSGKGTQAERLAKAYGLTHLDIGQLIREEAKKDARIRAMIDMGRLLPDALPNKLVKEHLPDDGWILDGYPRNLAHAEFLDQFNEPDTVIFLDINDKTSIERLGKRRICSKCGTTTTADHKTCPACKGRLIHREDDKPTAIKKRLELYHDVTEPLLEYYKPRKIAHVIDGTQSADKVFADIVKIL